MVYCRSGIKILALSYMVIELYTIIKDGNSMYVQIVYFGVQ